MLGTRSDVHRRCGRDRSSRMGTGLGRRRRIRGGRRAVRPDPHPARAVPDLPQVSCRPIGLLLRRQDSNLDHRNQNPRCCLYTTAEERAPTRRHMVPRPLRSLQRNPPSVIGAGIAESASGHHRRRADNLRFSYLCRAGHPAFRRRCEHDGTAAWRPSAPVDLRSTGR